MQKMKGNTIAKTLTGGLLMVSLVACGSGQQGETPQANPSAPPAQQNSSGDPEWDQIVEAAKKEGEVVIFGQPTVGREDIFKQFEKAYPEIKMKYSGMRPNESGPRIVAEQQQDRYLVDLYFEVPPDFLPREAFSPVLDYFVRPESKDDNNWVGGFQKGFELVSNADNVYPFAVQVIPSIHVNNDVIPKGEINNYDDLLDPKWKGKIIIGSFDRTAQGSGALNGLLMMKGEDYVKKLIEEQETQYRIFDNRQILENFATGKFPIVIGPTPAQVNEFVTQGVIKEVTKIEDEVNTAVNPANLSVLKNPPHPNATKVFIDWFVSQEAQSYWVNHTDGFISRRAGAENTNPNVSGWEKVDPQHSNHTDEGRASHEWVVEYGKQLMSK